MHLFAASLLGSYVNLAQKRVLAMQVMGPNPRPRHIHDPLTNAKHAQKLRGCRCCCVDGGRGHRILLLASQVGALREGSFSDGAVIGRRPMGGIESGCSHRLRHTGGRCNPRKRRAKDTFAVGRRAAKSRCEFLQILMARPPKR